MGASLLDGVVMTMRTIELRLSAQQLHFPKARFPPAMLCAPRRAGRHCIQRHPLAKRTRARCCWTVVHRWSLERSWYCMPMPVMHSTHFDMCILQISSVSHASQPCPMVHRHPRQLPASAVSSLSRSTKAMCPATRNCSTPGLCWRIGHSRQSAWFGASRPVLESNVGLRSVVRLVRVVGVARYFSPLVGDETADRWLCSQRTSARTHRAMDLGLSTTGLHAAASSCRKRSCRFLRAAAGPWRIAGGSRLSGTAVRLVMFAHAPRLPSA